MVCFREYIKESGEGRKILTIGNIKEMFNLLKKDCKPFLNEIRKKKGFMLRRSIRSEEYFLKIKPRKDRRPLDTDIESHKILDKAFYNVFGWKARSEGVFAIPKGWSMDDHFFFPIGKYKYIWSPFVDDLFNTRRNIKDMKVKDLEDWIKKEEYTDKNMINNKGYEMMFKCKQYLMKPSYIENQNKLVIMH